MAVPEADLPVSVIIVTYNSASVVLDAIASVDPRAEVIVVDNASSDGTTELLRERSVRLIANSENVGFGSACNVGAAVSTRDFLFFLNPDARLQAGALRRLAQAATQQPKYGAFNPRILAPDGQQFQRRMSRLLPRELNERLRQPLNGDRDVEILSGAALFCRRADFNAIGGFDEQIFLYCEDDDLSVRLRGNGKLLGYVHDAVVEHVGGASTSDVPVLEETKSYHFMKATIYATSKHAVSFRRRYKLLQYALKLVLGIITANKRQKAKYRGYIKALVEPEHSGRDRKNTSKPIWGRGG